MFKMLLRLYLESQRPLDDIYELILLLNNTIREPFDDLPSALNLGEQKLKKLFLEVFALLPQILNEDLKKQGDLAELALKYKSKQAKPFVKPKPITINRLLMSMRQIVDTQKTQNSGTEKMNILTCLFQDSNKLEAKYITRIALGKMRLGMQKKTILVSISDLLCYLMLIKKKYIKQYSTDKPIVDYIDQAYRVVTSFKCTQGMIEQKLKTLDIEQNLTPEQINQIIQMTDVNQLISQYLGHMVINKSDFGDNIRLLASVYVYHSYQLVPSFNNLIKNINNLQETKIQHFIPLEPMLAKPTTSFDNELTQQPLYFGEHKYDGFRAQIHFKNETLKIYSRQQENMDEKFYDVLETIRDMLNKIPQKPASFILDSEIIPIDRKTGQIKPFQYLSRRLQSVTLENKEEQEAKTCKVRIMNFDLIEFNGFDLTKTPFIIRRQILRNTFQETELYKFCNSSLINNIEDLHKKLEEAVQAQTEGLIIKSVNGLYQPDKRSDDWLKLKKDYLQNVGDSFDLVIIGGTMGKGKRTGKIGSYLAACYNDKTDKFETVTQLGTGVTDEDLALLTQKLEEVKIKGKQANVIINDKLIPEFYFDSLNSVVVEVKVADLSNSPVHSCGITDLGYGIAGRLPRIIRIRSDKKPIDCTTTQYIIDCYKRQANRQQQNKQNNQEFNIKEESQSSYIEENYEDDDL